MLKRTTTNEGDYIDVALSESAMPLAMVSWVESYISKQDRGNLSLTGANAYYRIYYARDGFPMALGAIEVKFWTNFCTAIGRTEWIDNYTDPSRQPYLIQSLTEMFKTRTANEWGKLLGEVDCCFTRITSPHELLDDSHIQVRGMVGVTDDGVPWMRSPIRLMDDDTIDLSPAPDYGANTDAVLKDLGYTESELEQLAQSNIIRQHQ